MKASYFPSLDLIVITYAGSLDGLPLDVSEMSFEMERWSAHLRKMYPNIMGFFFLLFYESGI
jgi:hypothetical protein